MAAPKEALRVRELHQPGEPWSINDRYRLPLLNLTAKSVRSIVHSVKTITDLELQNKQDYEEFIALCDRDILFFLKITKQYYLLSKLFEDPRVNAKWIKLINSLKHHDRKIRQQRHLHEFKSSTRDTTTNLAHSDLFQLVHPDPNLSNLAKWQHYERELQRITFIYHNQAVQMYDEAIGADLNHFRNIIEDLKQHEKQIQGPEEDQVQYRNKVREKIAHLEITERHMVHRWRAIKNSHASSTDAVSQVQSEAQKHSHMRGLHGSVQQAFRDLDVSFIKNPLILKRIQATLDAQKSSNAVVLNRMNEHTINFQAKREQVLSLVEASQNALKMEMHERIHSVIHSLKEMNFSLLSELQKQSVNDAISKLEDFYTRAKASNDFREVQSLLTRCHDELTKVQGILPNQAISFLQSDLDALEKMKLLSSEEPIFSVKPSAPAFNQLEQERMPSPSAPDLPKQPPAETTETADIGYISTSNVVIAPSAPPQEPQPQAVQATQPNPPDSPKNTKPDNFEQVVVRTVILQPSAPEKEPAPPSVDTVNTAEIPAREMVKPSAPPLPNESEEGVAPQIEGAPPHLNDLSHQQGEPDHPSVEVEGVKDTRTSPDASDNTRNLAPRGPVAFFKQQTRNMQQSKAVEPENRAPEGQVEGGMTAQTSTPEGSNSKSIVNNTSGNTTAHVFINETRSVSAIEAQRNIKLGLIDDRNASPNQRIFNSNLESILSKIKFVLTSKKMSYENLILAHKSIELIENIKRNGNFEKVSTAEMKSLYANFETLTETYQDLEKLRPKLDAINDLVVSFVQDPTISNLIK